MPSDRNLAHRAAADLVRRYHRSHEDHRLLLCAEAHWRTVAALLEIVEAQRGALTDLRDDAHHWIRCGRPAGGCKECGGLVECWARCAFGRHMDAANAALALTDPEESDAT